MLKLWNALHRELEELRPITPSQIGMYTCGPTVYNPATIGNFRSYIFEDVLKRTLLSSGFRVHHVMNVTDVGHLVGDGDVGEDKVEREAAKTGQSARDIATMYEERFVADALKLNILVPEEEDRPHATEYIQEQIALAETLEKKGFTYRTSDGLYFDTSKFLGYGKLSGQRLDDKEEGARVEANPEKRNPTDFALWKFSPTGQKRQMEWESPWGIGFPGWHLECSAMSKKLLGQPFDIHCGGVDHIAVHHENEIAQSEAAFGKPLANYWLHNEFLLINGGRMGKSEGNAYTLDDVVAKGFDPLAFRYFCLGAHYRTKLNFTWTALDAAQSALRKLQAIARGLPVGAHDKALPRDFTAAMEEDLNTPQALAVLWDFLKSDAAEEEKSAVLLLMDSVLGLGLADILGKPFDIPDEVILLAEERQLARQNMEWHKSDVIREKIKEKGWLIEDGKDETFHLIPMS